MDKTPGQVAIEAWHECGNGFERKMEHVAKAVIDHVRPQIEREAYEKVAILVKIKRASCVTKGQTDELDALLAAIRALAEGE